MWLSFLALSYKDGNGMKKFFYCGKVILFFNKEFYKTFFAYVFVERSSFIYIFMYMGSLEGSTGIWKPDFRAG